MPFEVCLRAGLRRYTRLGIVCVSLAFGQVAMAESKPSIEPIKSASFCLALISDQSVQEEIRNLSIQKDDSRKIQTFYSHGNFSSKVFLRAETFSEHPNVFCNTFLRSAERPDDLLEALFGALQQRAPDFDPNASNLTNSDDENVWGPFCLDKTRGVSLLLSGPESDIMRNLSDLNYVIQFRHIAKLNEACVGVS